MHFLSQVPDFRLKYFDLIYLWVKVWQTRRGCHMSCIHRSCLCELGCSVERIQLMCCEWTTERHSRHQCAINWLWGREALIQNYRELVVQLWSVLTPWLHLVLNVSLEQVQSSPLVGRMQLTLKDVIGCSSKDIWTQAACWTTWRCTYCMDRCEGWSHTCYPVCNLRCM